MKEMVCVMKLAASSEIGFHVIEAMKKVQKAMCPVYSFQSVDFEYNFDERNVRTESLYWPLWILYSVTQHKMSKAVARKPIVLMIFCTLRARSLQWSFLNG